MPHSFNHINKVQNIWHNPSNLYVSDPSDPSNPSKFQIFYAVCLIDSKI